LILQKQKLVQASTPTALMFSRPLETI